MVDQENFVLEEGKAFWRLLVQRRYFRAMRDYADELIQTRMAAVLRKRHVMNAWKRLHSVMLEETFHATRIQCAWRQKQARRNLLRKLRLWRIKEIKKREKQANIRRRVNQAKARLTRFVYGWVDEYKAQQRQKAFQELVKQRQTYERQLAIEAEQAKKAKLKLYVYSTLFPRASQEIDFQNQVLRQKVRGVPCNTGHQDTEGVARVQGPSERRSTDRRDESYEGCAHAQCSYSRAAGVPQAYRAYHKFGDSHSNVLPWISCADECEAAKEVHPDQHWKEEAHCILQQGFAVLRKAQLLVAHKII